MLLGFDNNIKRRFISESVPGVNGELRWTLPTCSRVRCRGALLDATNKLGHDDSCTIFAGELCSSFKHIDRSPDAEAFDQVVSVFQTIDGVKVSKSKYRTPKEGRIRIPVPKIIDLSLFERAAERLKENKRLSIRNNKKNEYLVSSIVRCAHCDYAVYGRPASDLHPGRRRYCRCLGRDQHRMPAGKICVAPPMRTEIIDDLVWDATKRLIKSPELVIKEYANRVEKKKNEATSREQILNKKNLELGCTQREKERMLDLYQFARLELDEIEARLKSIRSKTYKIQQEINLLKHDEQIESQRLQVIQRFEDFCSTLTTNLEELSFTDRKKIIRLLVTNVIIDTLNGEISVNHILALAQEMYPLRSRTYDTRYGFLFWRKFCVQAPRRLAGLIS